jgi:predicted DNA-binding protein (UPF0251 family)
MEMRDPSLQDQNLKEQILNDASASDAEVAQDNAKTDNFETVAPAQCDTEPVIEDDMAQAELEAEDSDDDNAALSVDSLLAVARELDAKDVDEVSNDQIRRLRQHAGALHKATVEADRKAFIAEGNAPEDFVEPEPNADLATLIAAIRDRKIARAAELDTLRLANLDRKKAIIEEISSLAIDTDNVNRTFQRYRELQDEFNAVGDVPQTEETAIWKQFQEARERYTDNLKINKELRDYDFKKNLETKQALLAEAQALDKEEDVIAAYRKLQELHVKWRQIGPVAKELRDEIWNAFRAASVEINKKYQSHFEERKAREAENEQAKTALCEKIEAIDLSAIKSYKAWEDATQSIIDLQTAWRALGYASRKMNKVLFARFRESCDKFFAAKADYYKNTREEFAQNLAKKISLCERAEALRDSTDWRATTDEYIKLQREWKTIGPVTKKHSDVVWKRFLAACDYFFEQKKKANSGTRQVEVANLKAKRDIIAKLDEITAETPREEAIATLRELQNQWQQIGHVPFREKDKIYETYRAKVDELRDSLNLKETRARIDRYRNTVAELESDDNKLYRERERLLRNADNKRSELRTYENNLGFLSSKSKSGDSMMREFNRKIERIKNDIATLEEQIRIIDSKLQ